MTYKELRQLYDACHDYGTVVSGEWPTWLAVKSAKSEGRLVGRDAGENGYIKIVGSDECHITFKVDD